MVHPDVVDLGAGQTWNGKRYWMVATPYPNSDNTEENPSIWCSDDGQTWAVPAGATNPFVAYPGVSGEYNSDPDLTIHDGTAYVVWRKYGTPAEVKIISTTDAVNWSAHEVLISSNPATSDPTSPAVCFDGTTWHLWAVETKATPHTVLHFTAAAIDGPWSAPTTTNLTAPFAKSIWHIDVVLRDGTYHALINVNNGSTDGGELWKATSTDGDTWAMEDEPTMVGNGTPGSWDQSLYRATMQPIEGGWAIWYGSASGPLGWQVGYTERTGV